MIEEWGFNIGEDACLEEDTQAVVSDHGVGHGEEEQGHQVEVLVEKLAVDLAQREKEFDAVSVHSLADEVVGRNACAGESPKASSSPPEVITVRDSLVSDTQRSVEGGSHVVCRLRHSSCPPGRERPVNSGPWSLEWLHDHTIGDAGILFSGKQKRRLIGSSPSVSVSKRKKVGGVLRHTMNLKKVVRLPSKDRREVLKILRKEVQKRSGRRRSDKSAEMVQQGRLQSDSSMMSVNKDWEHWVVLHGDEKVVAEDVQAVGKAIGLQLESGTGNVFSVLSRGERRKKLRSGLVLGEVGGCVRAGRKGEGVVRGLGVYYEGG
ncbi:hypothetical protein P8452_51562 [Trifolium repens]|nr:hypothetical protein P8452_51562 [Trifolium repens]